jgi:hypothetical protein
MISVATAVTSMSDDVEKNDMTTPDSVDTSMKLMSKQTVDAQGHGHVGSSLNAIQ